MKRIKIVHRAKVPETNSSSSHVIAIYSGNYGTLEDLGDCISPDGKILTIPGNREFGRYREEFGDILSKMQYACYGILGYNQKNRPMFEEVVKDFLGVEHIVYNWYDEDKFEEWADTHPDEDLDNCPFLYGPGGEKLDEPPMIDHESVDTMQNMVYENKETLKDFLFSSNSWLFSGEETADPGNYYPAMKDIGNTIIFQLKADNISLFSDNQYEDSVDFEVYPNFPYVDLSVPFDFHSYNWYRTPINNWINVGACNDTLSEDMLFILNSIWAEKINDKYFLRIGEIPNTIAENRIAVPWITKETFKYPFTMKFFPKSIFKGEEVKNFFNELRNDIGRGDGTNIDLYGNQKELFSINLIPKFDDIEINEFL